MPGGWQALRMGMAGASYLGNKFATRQAKQASQQQLDTSLGMQQAGYQGIQSNLTNAQNYVTGMIPSVADPRYTGGFYQPGAYSMTPNPNYVPGGSGPQLGGDVGGTKGTAAPGRLSAPTAPELRDPNSLQFNQLVPREIRDAKRGKLGERNAAATAEYDKQLAAYNAQPAEQPAGQGSPMDRIPNYGQDIINSLEERQRTTMGYLDNIGYQGHKDINESYDNATSQSNQASVDSGLYGSQVQAGINSGIARERAGSHTRLNEDVGQLKAGTYSGLSADVTNAKNQQRGEYASAMGSIPQNYMNTMNQYAGLRNANISNYTTNAANTVAGVNIQYPDQQQLMSMFQNMGSAQGMKGYREYLDSQQSMFGGNGGQMLGQTLGVGSMLLGAPEDMMGNYLLGNAAGQWAGYGL